MSDQTDENSIQPPPAEKYRYRQARIQITKELYLDEKYADVHFSFSSNDGTVTRVPAHKCLLAVVSDVFARMFYGELKETGDVTITDASAVAFKEFLQFFYLNEGDLTAEHIVTVMDLGNKYNVKSCVDACVKILKNGLTNDNVCNALSLALLYEQKELIKACEKRILVNTEDVFKTVDFLECSKEVLAHILDMKLLSCSEVDVFEACMAWVRVKGKQNAVSKAMVEKYLGNLYYKVRFASMTIQEFCKLGAKYSAVLRDDFHIITCLIADPGEISTNFNTSTRQVKWNENAIIECDRDPDDDSAAHFYALGTEENTTFSTNELLLLGSFDCNDIYSDASWEILSNLLVNVEVTEARTLDGTNAKVLSNMVAELETQYATVSFTHPILIRPDFFYTIRVKGFPKGCRFSSLEQHVCISLIDDIDIEFHNDRIKAGKIFGLIYGLGFNQI